MTKQHRPAKKILYGCFLVLYLFLMVYPLIYMLACSFMTEQELNSLVPTLWPKSLNLQNYIDALTRQPLLKYILNSFIVTIIGVALCVTLGCMASYALTRTRIRFKKTFLILILAISMLPTITLINPIFRMYSKLGLLNTHFGLALISSVMDLPMTIRFLTALFKNVPLSIEESAQLDGANMFQLFVRILLPLLKAGIFSISILVFIGVWNRFLLSQVLNQYESARTVVVGLTLYQTTHTIPFGTVAAASTITILPLMLMVLIFQKNILGGIMEGGVKE